jgi:hypothetical protein
MVGLNSFLYLQKAKRPNVRLIADSAMGRRTFTKEAAEENYAEAVNLIFANWVRCVEWQDLRDLQALGAPDPQLSTEMAFLLPPRCRSRHGRENASARSMLGEALVSFSLES